MKGRTMKRMNIEKRIYFGDNSYFVIYKPKSVEYTVAIYIVFDDITTIYSYYKKVGSKYVMKRINPSYKRGYSKNPEIRSKAWDFINKFINRFSEIDKSHLPLCLSN